MKDFPKYALLLIVLMILQIGVLNNLNLGGYINPYIYILFILVLPFSTPGWLLLLLSFFVGFIMDYFCNTLGLHMSAAVMLAFARPAIIRSISFGIQDEKSSPDLAHEGLGWFARYVVIGVLVHHSTLFLLETFSFRLFYLTIVRIILSSAVSIFFIILIEILRLQRHKD